MTNEKSTAADAAFNAILRDLLERAWPIDARLNSSELATRYGQSSGGVREALIRLAAKGFVLNFPQRGFRTIKGTPDSVRDHAIHRVAIEVEAARLSILNGDLSWEAELTAAHHGLSHLESKLNFIENPSFVELRFLTDAELAFHGALSSACGSKVLIEAQRDAFLRFRLHLISVDPGWGFRGSDSVKEHQVILEAALARDVAACSDAIRNHFAQFPKLVAAHDQENA